MYWSFLWQSGALYALNHLFEQTQTLTKMKLLQRTGFLHFLVTGSNDQEKRTQAEAHTWYTGKQSKLMEITTKSIQSSVVSFIRTATTPNQMIRNTIIPNGKRFSSTFSWANGNANDCELLVGLSVALGGAVLIAAIIVIVILVVRRKRCLRNPKLPKPSSDPPGVNTESYYATVVKNSQYDNTAMDGDDNLIPSPTEYADLNIVASS